MKEGKLWLTAALKGAAEVALACPILLAAAVYTVPHAGLTLWFAMLAFSYLCGFALARLFSLAHRALLLMIGALAAVGLFLPIFGAGAAGSWIGAGVGFVLFFRGHRARHSTWRADFPIQAMWMALALYLPMAVAFRIAERLQPYAGALLWLGLGSLAVAIFAASEHRLREAGASGRSSVPGAIRSANRVWTSLLFLAIVLIGSLGRIRDWLSERLAALMRLLSRIFASGKDARIDNIMDSSDGTVEMPLEQEGQTDAIWMDWLIKIVVVIAALAFAVFLVYVLYQAGKRLYPLIRTLVRWLTRGGEGGFAADAEYEDERESLLHWKKLRGDLSAQWQSWLDRRKEREPQWADLADNRERVRYLYRLFVRQGIGRGYAFKRHLTPNETGEDLARWERGEQRQSMSRLGRLYSQARYADERQSFEARELEALYQASRK